LARRFYEISDDQEVAGVSGLRDDAKLVIEPLARVGGEWGTVTLDRSLFRQADQQLVLRLDPGGKREGGDAILLGERDCRLFRDAKTILQDVLATRKGIGDLRCALEVEALIVVQPVGVGVVFAESDAEEDVVRVVIVAREEMRVV